MWVDLQIKHLCTIKIDYEVENELGRLPRDLARTYDQIYKRIQDDVHSAPWALNALMWILGAEEPLSPDEWAGGVSWALPRPDGNPPTLETPVLLDVCQNLVVHDGQRNVMRFAHLSVREFLETRDLDLQAGEMAAEMAASACLAVLLYPHTLKVKPTAYADFTPFHRYSIRYWPEHVLRCDDNGPTPHLSSTLGAFTGSFDHPADAYIHWFKAATTMSDDDVDNYIFRRKIQRLRSTPPNPLFAAAYFGFKKVCSHLWEPNTFDPNCTNDAQQTLLYLASREGHTATVRLLLQNGADLNHPTHRDDTAPLLAAIWRHSSEVLDLLLDAGAIFNSTRYSSIVLAGALNGNGAVMQLLFQRDASIEITEAVVSAAARNPGSGKEVMELLLQRDASIEITEAIVIAAMGNPGNGKEVMELLLQRDASIEITEAIVTAAAGNSHSGKEVIELLLQRDASIEITEAAVSAAAGNSHSGKEVMKLLLQRDDSTKITEAIISAAARNWTCGKEVMELLLQRDASIDITEAVISAAAGNLERGKEVMELLLQRDASIEITEAIVTAATGNPGSGKEVMELLLQRDASIEITEAIVTAAAGNSRSGGEVMELLLQRDARIEVTEAVVTAAAGNWDRGEEVMKLLLQTERAIVTKSSLIAAAFFGHQEWFAELRPKINANFVFPQNDTQCLTAAIEGGNMPILDACLESTHESNDTDDHGWTLHMVAIQSRNQMAIEKFQDASEEPMQPMPVTRWEVNPINSQFVSIDGDGTSLAYSGDFPGFPAEFHGLMIAGSFLGSGLSVKGNHPFPPGNIGKNYFEMEVLDSVESRCVIYLVRCAPINSSAATCAATCALDSAANASCIRNSRAYIAARRLITVMEIFGGGTKTRALTDRNTAKGIS
jgi:ankyrin repeat protein/predicted acetyltransferase